MALSKAETGIPVNDPAYQTTLQMRWLGTACYVLQLGDKAIFTDPFFTHQSLLRVALGSIRSDPGIIRKSVAGLTAPDAIFVGHSHYDHMLDLAECLKQPGWADVPVYGSVSTRNLLAGYGPQFTNTWKPVLTSNAWQEVAPGIRYQAVVATHGRQVPWLPLLYRGQVDTPRRKPPRRAGHFKVGEAYAFVFELSNDRASYTIYFVGAAHKDQEGFPHESVKSVDAAILCVPTWKLSQGYPTNILKRLNPRHVIASHYNNFLQVNGKATEVVALADMERFLARVQEGSDYGEFAGVLVPSVGTVLRFRKEKGVE